MAHFNKLKHNSYVNQKPRTYQKGGEMTNL